LSQQSSQTSLKMPPTNVAMMAACFAESVRSDDIYDFPPEPMIGNLTMNQVHDFTFYFHKFVISKNLYILRKMFSLANPLTIHLNSVTLCPNVTFIFLFLGGYKTMHC
jgi:hypothetical protein